MSKNESKCLDYKPAPILYISVRPREEEQNLISESHSYDFDLIRIHLGEQGPLQIPTTTTKASNVIQEIQSFAVTYNLSEDKIYFCELFYHVYSQNVKYVEVTKSTVMESASVMDNIILSCPSHNKNGKEEGHNNLQSVTETTLKIQCLLAKYYVSLVSSSVVKFNRCNSRNDGMNEFLNQSTLEFHPGNIDLLSRAMESKTTSLIYICKGLVDVLLYRSDDSLQNILYRVLLRQAMVKSAKDVVMLVDDDTLLSEFQSLLEDTFFMRELHLPFYIQVRIALFRYNVESPVEIKINSKKRQKRSTFGNELVKATMKQIISGDLLKFGIQSNCNVLLYGPPGTGKTSLVSYFAETYKLQLVNVESTQIVQSLYGEGEKHLINLFVSAIELAKRNTGSVLLFIDEIDALCSVPSSSLFKVLLQCFDEQINYNENASASNEENPGKLLNKVFVFGATNAPYTIHRSLINKFTQPILIDLPNEEERYHVLKGYISRMKLDPSVNVEEVARTISELTDSYSGADLEALCRHSAICCLRRAYKEKGPLRISKNDLMQSYEETISHKTENRAFLESCRMWNFYE